MKRSILVTGGVGYIGSHTVVELQQHGFQVIVIDNLCNSEKFILERIEKITGVKPVYYEVDLCDVVAVKKVFSSHAIELVIHFAAYKSVSESVAAPLKYFQNNLISLMNVLQVMEDSNVNSFIFSSSATVYGMPETLPANEQTSFQKALSAYGSTKQMGEEIIEKCCKASSLNAVSLRYFNPVGAHASALIGELPSGLPNNLFPYVMQTASGQIEKLTVFGNDYNTPDGTCLRDYIHVVDLAKAHVAAAKRLIQRKSTESYEVFNIGTGKATSVLEIINTFEKNTGKKLNYQIGRRREGDAAIVYADTEKANSILGWKAELGMDDMINSAWKWNSLSGAHKS
jgi:UDP-glucose 4-epimerase